MLINPIRIFMKDIMMQSTEEFRNAPKVTIYMTVEITNGPTIEIADQVPLSDETGVLDTALTLLATTARVASDSLASRYPEEASVTLEAAPNGNDE